MVHCSSEVEPYGDSFYHKVTFIFFFSQLLITTEELYHRTAGAIEVMKL